MDKDVGAPEGLDRVVRRLRDERAELDALEMDNVKRRSMSRRPQRNAALRGRAVIAVLTLGLLGAGAGGVMAVSGTSSGGASSALAQYKHPCPKHFHRHHGKCVRNGHPNPKPHKPHAKTHHPHHVKRHSATLTGFVKTHGSKTRYFFQWGTTTGAASDGGGSCTLSHTTASHFTSVAKSVSVVIGGLKPGTTYCYRLVAVNATGKSDGSVRAFRTNTPSNPAKNGRGFTG